MMMVLAAVVGSGLLYVLLSFIANLADCILCDITKNLLSFLTNSSAHTRGGRITRIVNLSLTTGYVLRHFKEAMVRPKLKKDSLDH